MHIDIDFVQILDRLDVKSPRNPINNHTLSK